MLANVMAALALLVSLLTAYSVVALARRWEEGHMPRSQVTALRKDLTQLCEVLDDMQEQAAKTANRNRMRRVRAAATEVPDPVTDPEGHRRYLEHKHRDVLARVRPPKEGAN